MKQLLYPLLGSALITIVPFLLTFEKGQDIVRGLFGFGYFAILLIFVSVKSLDCKRVNGHILKGIVLACLVVGLVSLSFVDLLNLLHLKGFSVGAYSLIPFVTSLLALGMVLKLQAFGVRGISFILFVSLMGHLAFKNFYPSQPLLQMPLVDYLSRSVVEIDRKILPDSFKEKYRVTDSVTITRDFIDTSRSNVVVLVESWGIPRDENRLQADLALFGEDSLNFGIHARMYSRTRTAEREDLIFKIQKDTSGRRDTLFLPAVLDSLGFQTVFLFGGESLEQWRFRYIRNVGFKNLYFAGSFGNSPEAVGDSVVALKIEELLQDSAKKFISWTTRDSRFPIQGKSVEELDSLYSERLYGTLKMVARLKGRFPQVRFIVQGDHEPILSPVPFQEKFYKRFVPYVILN